MNDNDLMNDGAKVDSTYRATTNLNTAIENPQINMNSAVGINIKDVGPNNLANDRFSNDNMVNTSFSNNIVSTDINNTYDRTSYTTENQFITNTTSVGGNYSQDVTPSFHEEVSYEPTMEEKKEKNNRFVIPRDFKIMLFIVFILFIFILVMPYIYDFFRNFQYETIR